MSQFQGLQFELKGKPDYAMAEVIIPANETIKIEASAMATMDSHLVMKTKMKGGLGRIFSKESLFINEFTSPHAPGKICIAPGPPGDMEHLYLNNEGVFLQASAYVASTMGVEVQTKFQGLTKGFFSGEGLFLIKCFGVGDLFFNTFGGLVSIDVKGEYVVDTGHIAAFTEGLEYNVSRVGGYKSLFLSGEGFVCRFSGEGRVWIQTRQLPAFASWIHPFRRVQRNNNT